MSDPRNMVMICGGLVADPEVRDKVINLRLAVDYSGNERDSDNRSGYFSVKYFTNNDNPTTKFVKGQIEAGNFKKGTQLMIAGKLSQERWKDNDGKSMSTVVIYADGVAYAARSNPAGSGGGDQATKAAATSDDAAPMPDRF